MAKTAAKKTAAPKAKKAGATAAANKIEMSFGTWVNKTARARGGLAPLVEAMRTDKSITDKTTVATGEKKYGSRVEFPMLVARYNAFLKRGSQSKAAA